MPCCYPEIHILHSLLPVGLRRGSYDVCLCGTLGKWEVEEGSPILNPKLLILVTIPLRIETLNYLETRPGVSVNPQIFVPFLASNQAKTKEGYFQLPGQGQESGPHSETACTISMFCQPLCLPALTLPSPS